MPRPLRPALALAALLAAAPACGSPGCSGAAPPPPVVFDAPDAATLPPLAPLPPDAGPMRRHLRLLDALDGAEVSTPALAAVEADPGPWVEATSPGALQRARSFASNGDAVDVTPDGLEVPDTAFATVPTWPLARYRLTARVRADEVEVDGDDVAAAVLVWELDEPWNGRPQGAEEHFTRSLVELRRPEVGPRGPDGYRPVTLEWTTLRATRQAAIGLVPRAELKEGRGYWPRVPKRDKAARRAPGPPPVFASLKLEMEQGSAGASLEEVRRSTASAPGAAHPLVTRLAIGSDERDVLLLPAPGRATFTVDVPAGAVLDLATGVARDLSADPTAPVSFRVVVEDGGDRAEHPLPSQAPADGARFTPHRIDLSRHAGRAVRLSLETQGTGGLAWAAFARPEVWVPDPSGSPATVVLISVDTLRADRLSCYGHPHPTSPAIDALAADGVLFEDHVTAANWTLPTHASMLTGLHPVAHRAAAWSPTVNEQLHSTVHPGAPSLAEPYRRAGFRTQAIVAAPFLLPVFGYGRGFDGYDSSPVHSSHHIAAHEDVTAGDVTASALRFLEENVHRPVFLFLHHWDVHYEFLPPVEAVRAARPDFAGEVPDYGAYYRKKGPLSVPLERLEEQVARRKDTTRYVAAREAFAADPEARADRELLSVLYDGEVRSVDGAIGRVVDLLKRQGRYDRATVVVTGDHGEELHERGRMGHGGPLLHPEVHRSPLVVKPPGGGGGRRSRAATATVDIAPTVLALSGLPVPPETQGRPLTAALRGEDLPDVPVVCEDGTHGTLMVRDGEWGLVAAAGQPEELYRVREDPAFAVDLAPAWPERVAALRRSAAEHFARAAWGGVLVLAGGPGGVRFEVSGRELSRDGRVWGWSSGTGRTRWVQRSGSTLNAGTSLGEGELAVVVFESGLPPGDALEVRRDGTTVPRAEWEVPSADPGALGRPGAVQAFQRGPRGDNAAASTGGETREQLRALGYVP